MSIKQYWNKIKQSEAKWQKQVLLPIFIILVATVSFGLGKLSATPEKETPVVIKKAPERIFTHINEAPQRENAQNFVASKNGTRYYLPWCGGASRINDENKIWFATREEAQEFGLLPAEGCLGI